MVQAGGGVPKNHSGPRPSNPATPACSRNGATAEMPAGTLGDAVDRFLKVTDSYRPGLFHYLEVPGLPATNNDLEQVFGAQRHHERRTTGRKVASPSLVVRGSVRVLAATLTCLAPISAQDLAAVDLVKWRETPGQSGEAYKVLSQDRRRAVGYVCPSICTFVEE